MAPRRLFRHHSDRAGGKRLAWKDVVAGLSPLHHTHLPKEITSGPKTYRWSIALNTTFSNWPGKDSTGKDRNAIFPV